MNPERSLISVVIVAHERLAELRRCLLSVFHQSHADIEVLVIDNSSDATAPEIRDAAESFGRSELSYIRADNASGYPRSRNLGVARATGEIVAFLDDDAFFGGPDALSRIARAFAERSSLGALACKIADPRTGAVDPKEFPHRDKTLPPDVPFETTYFVGAGHAIRKKAFEEAGAYDESFFYGMEELDLSFRILDAGYEIWYEPAVAVWHAPSPKGRVAERLMWQQMLENRIKLGVRTLPWRYVVVSVAAWTGKIIGITGSIPLAIRAWYRAALSLPRLIRARKALRSETVRKIRALRGRLAY